MRYYKGHTFLCQSYTLFFVLFCFGKSEELVYFSIMLSYGLPVYRSPRTLLSLHFNPLSCGEGELPMLRLKKEKTIISMNGRKKQGLDDMLLAVLLI